MNENLLRAAAAALGAPPEMVLRSAQARAAAEGTTVESVLEAWAGGVPSGAADEAPMATPEAEAPVPEMAAPEAEAPAEAEAAREAEAAPETAVPEVPAERPQPAVRPPEAPAVAPIPPPETVTLEAAADFEVVTTVATASIKERTRAPVPGWLGGLFVALPLLALLLLLQSGSPQCGQAGALGVDPVSGEIVNCDGSEFTGTGPGGGGGPNFLAMGRAIYAGQAGLAASPCSACHGGQGEGVGTNPALNGVLTTFSACADHVQWVTLGSQGWRSQVGSTYGDPGKPVNGGMPTFGTSLTEEQIRSVAVFERVQFGGEDRDTALVDCGLAEEETEGEQSGEGSGTQEGEGGGEETGGASGPDT